MTYLIRKNTRQYDAILRGRENTLMFQKNKCVQAGEIIRFVEVEHKKRTGRECRAVIKRVIRDRFVIFDIYRTEDRTWNSSKRNGST